MRAQAERLAAQRDAEAPQTRYSALTSPSESTISADEPSNPLASPLDRANMLSFVTLWWIQGLLRRGYKEPLKHADVWELPHRDQANTLQMRFDEAWANECARAQRKSTKPRFGVALWNTTKDTMVLAVVMIVLHAACLLIQPLFIKAIIAHLEDEEGTFGIDSGYGLALLLAATALIGTTAVNFSAFLTSRAGSNARMIVVNAVYQKVLRLSATVRRSMNTGEIITLASVDSERLLEAYVIGLWLIISPVLLVVVCILLGWQMNVYVGLAGAGAVALILTQVLSTARSVGQYRRRIAALSAERVKLTSEVLQGIRAIKFYGWEVAIQQQIQQARVREVVLLRKYNFMRLYNSVLLMFAPMAINAVCFMVFVLLGHEINVTTTFAVLALTNATRLPFSVLANSSVYVSEAMTSTTRVGNFLQAGEVQKVEEDDTTGGPSCELSLRDASFQWVEDAPTPTIDRISFSIVPGTLTIIVGKVGSGKSSLVNAILGEMLQTKGERVVRGDLAYASQQPWIQHQSLRENILFGETYEAEHYERVLMACQLLPDLEMLEHGDKTEIGERGINLSGGQKARVSIARAMYRVRHCDFLILDDPLSALDVHVANAVFAHGVNGIAAAKTRLLVLNSHYHLLPAAGRILVMEDGSISGDGTLEELSHKFPFLVSSSTNSENKHGDAAANTTKNPSLAVAQDEEDTQDDKKPAKLMVEEDRAVGSVTKKTYAKYLASSGWSVAIVTALLVLLFTLVQVVIFFCDWFVSRWSKGVYQLSEYQSMGIYLGLIGLSAVLTLGRGILFTEMGVRCSEKIHATYIRKVLLAPVTTFFDVTPVGRILNRFSRDLDQVDSPLPYYALMMLTIWFQMGAAFIICAVSTPFVLILYVPLTGAFFYVTRFFQRSARELKRLDSISRSPFLNLVSETVHGIDTIRSYGRTDDFSRKCRELLDENGKCYFAFATSTRWFAMRTDWLVSTILGVVAILIIATRSSVGQVAAGLGLTYAAQLTSIFQRVIFQATQVESYMTCFERISYFDTLEKEGEALRPAKVNPQWPQTGAITFENVSMRYRPELDLVLQDVSFTLLSGEKTGVCGRTGSGKSSLMSVLFRLVECANGRVLIDGVDIASMPVQALRAKLTIIPQDPMLFSGSLRLNLDPFQEREDAELWEVLRKVHLFDVVKRWGQGLDFQVAEKGDNISVGQRQLLCIARALVRQSKVVVMDEATANVDQESDKLIQQTVRESFAGNDTTVLTIAHRLETIMHSDKILVLDAGRVKEFDSPQALLLKTDGIYRSLVESSRSAAYE
ncbi:hypothetical protein Poli38472_011684 [Pythium oligandrum]|uniref:Uncharacterized protein n=1 Tax=Pythium oligandrum TaxID=41045 RepID=A0A8K1FDA1_PYTOL|nr:hypothetical protein Poli38472_011684 [Pythium oligandrum]|eukprot:TMW58096.1 hypothetical protein Poli38472_011684 [Pythium oligandrum]